MSQKLNVSSPQENAHDTFESKGLDKIKTLIDTGNREDFSSSLELISLKDIILDKDPIKDRAEAFYKVPESECDGIHDLSEEQAFILKRTKLQFNGK